MKTSMRLSGRAFVVSAVLLAAPLASRAADGTITVTGTVTNQTCTINGGGAASSFTVTLPTVSAAGFTAGNLTAGRTPFSIQLTSCVPATGSANVYFESGANVNAAGRLNNTGTATNLNVELLNSAQTVLNLAGTSGNQGSSAVAISGSGAATLNYYAQYRATATPVGAGTVNTSVTYTIVYQ